MSDNVCDDLKKAMSDTKSTFYVPNHVRIISREELMMEQILKNQMLMMSQFRKNCDIKSQNSFQEAINETQELLNGEMK